MECIYTLDNMPEGYEAHIFADDNAESPRGHDGRVATLINLNSRLDDIDEDEGDLREARDRWDWCDDRSFFDYMPAWLDTPVHRALHAQGREAMVRRYLSIFRPDVLAYVDYWSAGRENYGWGYVLRDDWDKAMGAGYGYVTPEEAFGEEVEIYRQWAECEVYGVIVTETESGREASLWGCYDDSHDLKYLRAVALSLIDEMK